MKVAVTATEPSLAGAVDPRFGRCSYFLIVETDEPGFDVVENPSVTLAGGAGIQSAQLMNEKGVRFVLTGSCGPNAYRTLSAAGIDTEVVATGDPRIPLWRDGPRSSAATAFTDILRSILDRDVQHGPERKTQDEEVASATFLADR